MLDDPRNMRMRRFRRKIGRHPDSQTRLSRGIMQHDYQYAHSCWPPPPHDRSLAEGVPESARRMNRDAQRRAAADAAATLVENDMVVGLGTGSTAAHFIDALIRRVRDENLRITAIPTSLRSDRQAREGGIQMTSFATVQQIDLTVDGADQILRGSLDLVKGLGGALLRDKIVAAASKRLVIIADSSKLVDKLGGKIPVPVEVAKFGWESTAARIAQLGCTPVRRWPKESEQPFQTDGGNYILDCTFGSLADPAGLEIALSHTIGVVECGLFIGMADMAFVAGSNGVEKLIRVK
jgi:ribose 5-phosphate isomerase A